MSTTTIYTHPDGHEITVGDGLLTACTSEGTAVSLPIGPAGLRDVAAKLLALHKLEHVDRAAGGFAVVLTPVLVLGIANLPKVEGCK